MAPWLPLVVMLAAPEPADASEIKVPPVEPVRAWATDMADPAGLTRFHLLTTASFADADSAFSGNTTWAYEARAHVRLTRGVALSAVLPFGVATRVEAAGFLGNIGAGVTVGGEVFERDAVLVRLAGALDVYAPSASGDDTKRPEQLAVAAVRAYEPQLFLPASLSFRGRFGGELDVRDLALALELGLTPTASFAEDARGFALLFGVAARASYRVATSFEPYLEVAATTQIAGDGDIAPPVLLTPGLRFHIADAFDPAFFVSFNFVAAHAVVFGVDLAAAIRPGPVKAASRAKERDDFFRD